jgi:hypothetical protein
MVEQMWAAPWEASTKNRFQRNRNNCYRFEKDKFDPVCSVEFPWDAQARIMDGPCIVPDLPKERGHFTGMNAFPWQTCGFVTIRCCHLMRQLGSR